MTKYTSFLHNSALARYLFVSLINICLLIFSYAHAGCLDQKRLLGVNLSGGEFGPGKIPGVIFKDYIYPSAQDLSYFKSQGMNAVRVPFRWERIQRQINTPLENSEVEQLRKVVGIAQKMGICIILDLHNFGNYQGYAVGSADLPVSAFIDVWLRLYQAFSNPDETAFGLMNEPASVPVAQWMQIAQQTVLSLREAGARNLLIIPSGRWSGAHEWDKTYDGISAANGFRSFRDPLNNFAIELHQYADANYSGQSSKCIDPTRLRIIMANVTTWAKQEKKRFFLGEFGVASSPECLTSLKILLESMQDSDAWLGWTYWSAGPWWGNYPFSIQPKINQTSEQLKIINLFLPQK
jgi:endoglucanase